MQLRILRGKSRFQRVGTPVEFQGRPSVSRGCVVTTATVLAGVLIFRQMTPSLANDCIHGHGLCLAGVTPSNSRHVCRARVQDAGGACYESPSGQRLGYTSEQVLDLIHEQDDLCNGLENLATGAVIANDVDTAKACQACTCAALVAHTHL